MYEPSEPLILSRPALARHGILLKGNDLLGKPVLTYGDRRQLATVQDLFFDYQAAQVMAFVVDKPGWRCDSQIIPWSGIQAVTPTAVVTWSASMQVTAGKLYHIRQILEHEHLAVGTPFRSQAGQILGELKDIYFLLHTGTLAGYELLGGVFASKVTGFSFVPAWPAPALRAGVAYVPTAVMRQMEVKRPYLRSGEPSQEAVGQRLLWDIRTRGGGLIAPAGQIVTRDLLTLARAHHQEQALLAATGQAPPTRN